MADTCPTCEMIDILFEKLVCKLLDKINEAQLKPQMYTYCEDIVLDRPVLGLHGLDLSLRTENALRSLEVRTIRDLIQKKEDELLKVKNFGRKSLYDVKLALFELGLHLGMKIEEVA